MQYKKAFTMSKLAIHKRNVTNQKTNSTKNEALEVLEWKCECENCWKREENSKGNLSLKFPIHKWVFKISPTRIGRLIMYGLCPSHRMWENGCMPGCFSWRTPL